MSNQRHYQHTATNRDRCEFFRQILPLAFIVNVQRLNCSESLARQTCTLSVEEVLTEFQTRDIRPPVAALGVLRKFIGPNNRRPVHLD
jgi:hypothetical protein